MITIIGAHSALGKFLYERLGKGHRYVSRRRDERSGFVQVERYEDIPDEVFENSAAVINCTGITDSRSPEIEHVNIALPVAIAKQAKRVGASKFVQISSFSVYGHQPCVSANTLPSPVTAYGQSKWSAEQALSALSSDRFAICNLRLPMLYGGGPSKLQKLIRIWRVVHAVPIPTGDVRRSMLHFDFAAQAAIAVVSDNLDGVQLAADPAIFSYKAVAKCLTQTTGRQHLAIPLPPALLRLTRLVSTELHQSLFVDSYVEDDANLIVRHNLASRLYDDIARLAVK